MERIVSRFVARLRSNGVRVSPGESIDAVQALGAAGVHDRSHARALLQLTLVKNVRDLAIFGRVFDEFFGRAAEARRDPQEVLDGAILKLERDARAHRRGDEGEKSEAELVVEDDDLDDVPLDRLEEAGSDPDDRPRLAVDTGRTPGEMAKQAKRLSNYTQGPIYLDPKPDSLDRWLNTGVKPFTAQELAAMDDVVARMLRRLKKDVRQMKSRQSRGRLNVIKTLRKNTRHGMVPFVRVLRRKRKEMPRIVVLCDVSVSVSHASRFMLLLLHTLQKGVLDVRSFIFNKEIAEVTALLRSMPVNHLLETVDSGELVNLHDNSDFGHVFLAFRKHHLESLRGRPAVIILGDARNNYNEAHDEVLAQIRERAGYMMWLTPEDRSSWKLGDCLMDTYGHSCDRVEVVKNVEELSLIVEQLVRTCCSRAAASPHSRRLLQWTGHGLILPKA
jgi:hypothetical protein